VIGLSNIFFVALKILSLKVQSLFCNNVATCFHSSIIHLYLVETSFNQGILLSLNLDNSFANSFIKLAALSQTSSGLALAFISLSSNLNLLSVTFHFQTTAVISLFIIVCAF
jgi:hypothetical protein